MDRGTIHQAAWLCYINGLEIPVMSVETNFAVWQMPSAVIQLIPHPMMERIGHEDRLQVALFYLDSFMDPGNPQFRLLGEFEVDGWSYNTSPLGRSITLNCVSHIQIFKQMFFDDLTAYKEKVIKKYTGQILYEQQGSIEFVGTPQINEPGYTGDQSLDAALRQDAAENRNVVATKEVKTQIIRTTLIKRPIDLVLTIFRSIMSPVKSSKLKKKSNKTPTPEEAADKANKKATKESGESEVDDMMGQTEIRTPGTTSDTSTSVIKKNFFARWMRMTGFHKRWIALPSFEEDIVDGGVFPIIKETGGTKALTALKKYVGPRGGSAWDMFMNVYIPMYMELAMMPSPPAVGVAKNMGTILGNKAKGSKEFRGLATFYIKPQCMFSIPPMCNVLFPSIVSSISYTESFIDQPTRIKLQGGRGSSLARVISSGMGSLFKSVVQQELAGGYPWVIHKRIQQYLKAPGSNPGNLLIFPEELFKGPVERDLGMPPWLLRIQKAYSGTPNKPAEEWKTITDTEIKELLFKSDEDVAAVKGTSDYEKLQAEALDIKKGAQAEGGEGGAVLVAPDTTNAETKKDKNKALVVPKGAQALIAKYIQYEFFKARYECRNASVNLTGFNPYIAPGFPAVCFDDIKSGMHITGYVTGVGHRWSAQSGAPQMSTDVSLMFARTLVEQERDNVPEPLTTVGKILQDDAKATNFYKSLFFQTKDPHKRITYDSANTLEYTNETFKERKPTAEYAEIFDNYDAAMRLVARPGCTLIEYVELWHNKTISELENEDVLRGKRTSFYSSLQDSAPDSGLGGAIFWDRIYKLKQGPGTDPGAKVTNVNNNAAQTAKTTGSDGWMPVDEKRGNMAQTRADWDSTLELYRKIIYSEDGNLAPQR